jgi:FG-GAP repeat
MRSPAQRHRRRGPQSLSDAPVQMSRGASYDAFGWSLGMGDVGGDTSDELAVGAPPAETGRDASGAVYVYSVGPDALLASTPAVATWTCEHADNQLLLGVSMRGDLYGDGAGDLVMGAVGAWEGRVTKGGKAYVAAGRSGLVGGGVSDLGSGYTNCEGAHDVGSVYLYWGESCV